MSRIVYPLRLHGTHFELVFSVGRHKRRLGKKPRSATQYSSSHFTKSGEFISFRLEKLKRRHLSVQTRLKFEPSII